MSFSAGFPEPFGNAVGSFQLYGKFLQEQAAAAGLREMVLKPVPNAKMYWGRRGFRPQRKPPMWVLKI